MQFSDFVENFLNFLREAEQQYSIAQADEAEANDRTQDILHAIEFGEYNYRRTATLTKRLRDIRVARRDAKNRMELCQTVNEWTNANRKSIEQLQVVLGKLRKTEKTIQYRKYMDRTDAMEGLKPDDEITAA
jgi:hypothetical protein